MSKKTLNLDELLELIDQEEKKKAGEHVKEVPQVNIDNSDKDINKTAYKFIQTFSIAQGEIKYPNYVIFYHFRLWCSIKNYYQKIGLTEFFRTFNKYFNQVRTGRQRYYLLNDSLEMDDETLRKAKQHSNMHRGIRRSLRDKKQQAKQSKVSSTEETTES